VVAPYLWRQKIGTLDLVVLTHPDSDHLNGLLFILEHFKVKEVWSNQEPCALAGCRQWREIVARRHICEPSFEKLPPKSERGGVRLDLLNPPSDFLIRRETENWRDANNNSLVLKVSWRAVSVLFTGDIGMSAEAEILERRGAEALRSTILWVPHHGSRKSSSEAFLAAVRPQVAIIAVGAGNRFGFPHENVLERLAKIGSRCLRTDQCGAVLIRTDGHNYQVTAYEETRR